MRSPESDITAELIRELLIDQHPDLADHLLSLGARGWDNQLWRLGDDFAVRLPWATQFADALLRKEYTWLPVLAPRLPLRVPVPFRLGPDLGHGSGLIAGAIRSPAGSSSRWAEPAH